MVLTLCLIWMTPGRCSHASPSTWIGNGSPSNIVTLTEEHCAILWLGVESIIEYQTNKILWCRKIFEQRALVLTTRFLWHCIAWLDMALTLVAFSAIERAKWVVPKTAITSNILSLKDGVTNVWINIICHWIVTCHFTYT